METLERQSLVVASINLLDDELVPRHRPQIERLPMASEQLRKVNPDVVFASEGESADHLKLYADLAGLAIAGQPYRLGNDEWMSFAVKPELAEDAKVEFVPFRHRDDETGYLRMYLAGVRWVGAHYPHRIFGDWMNRIRSSKQIIHDGEADPMPTVAEADFNDIQRHYSRRLFTRNGFTEVHSHERPYFPYKPFRGVSVPRLLPKWSLDAIFVSSGDFVIRNSGYSHSEATDHPLIHAELELVRTAIL
jgi:hypothetical protein